jgi:hypothetical protein
VVRYPFLYMTGHGNVRFSEEEVRLLRRYLLGGGFLHVDDNYGLDESFRREIRRVFPDRELQELPRRIRCSACSTSCRGPAEDPPSTRASRRRRSASSTGAARAVLQLRVGSRQRLGGRGPARHPPELREAALRMGVNLFLYALAQVAP